MESLIHSVEGECEAYHQEGTKTTMTITNGHLSSIEKKHVKGTGFRVFVDGCCGFAYATDENRMKEAVDLASTLARVSTEKKSIPTPGKYQVVNNLSDPKIENMNTEELVEIASEIIQGARENGGHPAYGSIELANLHHRIATSCGIEQEFHETSCYAGIDVEVDGFFGTATLYARNSCPELLELGQRASSIAAASRNPRKIEGGIMPIILRPPAVSKVFEHLLVPSLLADNIDSSFLKDGLGKEVSSRFTLVDDGTLRGGIGSRPFDGEGSPSRKTVMIEKGILTSFLHDATTAFKHCTESTGNAVRSSFSTPPTVYISNLVLLPEYKTDELIEDTRKGIVVHDLMGSFSFDFATGKFGFEAKNVFLIENGEIKYPAVDVTVAGTIDDVLSTIEPGNDLKQEGLLIVPSTRIVGSVFAP